MAAKIDVMTANARTIGATNYSPTALDMESKPLVDKSETVPIRNIGKKATKKISTPVGKVKSKKKSKAKAKKKSS